MHNVVSLEHHRRSVAPEESDTVETLKALLAHAKLGHITGLTIAWRCQDGKHCGMTTGIYATDHLAALGATTKLWSQINDQHDLTN